MNSDELVALLELSPDEIERLWENTINERKRSPITKIDRLELNILREKLLSVALERSQDDRWAEVCCYLDHWFSDYDPTIKAPCYCSECQQYVFKNRG
jgi:hypothetical protein